MSSALADSVNDLRTLISGDGAVKSPTNIRVLGDHALGTHRCEAHSDLVPELDARDGDTGRFVGVDLVEIEDGALRLDSEKA